MTQMFKGLSDCSSGLAKRIYDNLVADRARMSFTGTATTAETNFLKALAWATASAVIDEIVDNGRTVVGVSNGALQVDSTDTSTGPPKVERELRIR